MAADPRAPDAQRLAAPGKKSGDEGHPRRTRRAGRPLPSASCSAPAASSARPTRPGSCRPSSARRAGTRARRPSSSARRPAPSPAPRCASACPPPTWRPRSTGCPPRAGAAPSCAASSPPTPSRSRRRRSAPCCDPGTCPRPRSSRGSVRRPLAFRPDVAAMTLAARGAGSTSPSGPAGLDEHMGEPLARRPAHLHRAALRRGPGRLRPRGRAAGPAGRGRAGVVRHPRLLPPGRHRRHRVRRRRRALGHQRRRAAVRRARPGRSSISSMSAAHGSANGADGWLRRIGAPAHGARDRPARGGRHRA